MAQRRIVIIDGHPDPDPGRFVHALTDAYASAASKAGHQVRRVAIAELDFAVLRNVADWLEGEPAAAIGAVQADILWADHLVIAYPLWLGDVPALLKALLEQVLRPGFAFEYQTSGLPKQLLKGRSARVIVTMGMPTLFYKWVFHAHSLKSLERNILKFVGFAPVDHTLFGTVEDAGKRETALEDMRKLGENGD